MDSVHGIGGLDWLRLVKIVFDRAFCSQKEPNAKNILNHSARNAFACDALYNPNVHTFHVSSSSSDLPSVSTMPIFCTPG